MRTKSQLKAGITQVTKVNWENITLERNYSK